MHATWKKGNLVYNAPGMHVVLHGFLPIFPPTITIIQNIICTSSLKRKPGSCCLLHSASFPFIFIILFIHVSTIFCHQSTGQGWRRRGWRRRRSVFHGGLGIPKEIVVAREKVNPVYVIMQALRFQRVLHHWRGSEKEGWRVLAFHWMLLGKVNKKWDCFEVESYKAERWWKVEEVGQPLTVMCVKKLRACIGDNERYACWSRLLNLCHSMHLHELKSSWTKSSWNIVEFSFVCNIYLN